MVRETLQFVTASHMDTVMETAIDFARRPRKAKKTARGAVRRRTNGASAPVVQ